MAEQTPFTTSIKELPQFAESKNDLNAEAYLADLGLNWNNLQGKEVLDIGAGLGRFAQAAQKRGIKVISVDMHPEWQTEAGVTPINVPYLVADARSHLPFPDESFDLIVSRAAVHSMADSRDNLEKVVSEAKRLLKKGGEFRFGPGIIEIREMSKEEREKWSKYVERYLSGDSFTEQENKEAQMLFDKVEQLRVGEEREKMEFANVSQVERTAQLIQKSLETMQQIEPDITIHKGNEARVDEYRGDVYYSMKK